jgi:hypothetical protein
MGVIFPDMVYRMDDGNQPIPLLSEYINCVDKMKTILGLETKDLGIDSILD